MIVTPEMEDLKTKADVLEDMASTFYQITRDKFNPTTVLSAAIDLSNAADDVYQLAKTCYAQSIGEGGSDVR